MGVLGRDLKVIQRVAEPSAVRGSFGFLRAPRDDSRFVVGVGAGRSGSEAQVVMQVRGERSSPLGHALCTTKRRASEGREYRM
ncbi:hypothetical protein TSUD_335520 [Trifolium subterraneum]|uniref:Uncharacterized protein n=1 Tax=Trifolium subterraneum TaxID=3900 RepID=A0A2Z6MM07_TRISU|nr:hypothetical protein TSUD_335520 [Trifolium subterraneum]